MTKCRKKNNGNNERVPASEVLKNLYLYLVRPQLERRLSLVKLRNDIRLGINYILNLDEVPIGDPNRPEFPKRVRCGLCGKNDDHKTKLQCPSCLRVMCDIHRVYLYVQCHETD